VANKYQNSKWSYLFLFLLVFFTMIFQGGYFTTILLILNMGCIVYILLNKEKVNVDVNLALMFMLLFVMITSTIFKSIDYYVAISELLKYSLLPLSYIIFLKLKDREKIKAVFFRAMLVLMGFGLLGVLGVTVIDGMVTLNGNRLQSFLQYANTTALFMGIGALFSLDYFMKSKKKQYIVFGLLFTTALLLTQSRITFVLFFIIVAFYIFRFFNKKTKVIFTSSVVGLLILLFIVGGRIIRLSIFEPTLIERIITFQDAAVILFKETFGLGLGVGNWQFMQFLYQSAPYQVRYIHNIYLQVAMDGGLIAMVLFCGLILYPLLKSYKQKSIYLYIYIFVIIHSLLEVNFNFGIVILFFTYLLTCLHEPVSRNQGVASLKWDKFSMAMRHVKYALLIPLAILIVLLVSEILISNGNAEAISNREKANSLYQVAYKLNPLNNELLFKQAQMERNIEQAMAYLEQSYHENPYDYKVLKALSEGYLYKKQYNQAYFYAEHLVHIFPYSQQHQLLAEEILRQYKESDTIATNEYEQLHHRLQNEITLKNESINVLYQYINEQFNY